MKGLKSTNFLILAAGTLFVILFVSANLNSRLSKKLSVPRAASQNVLEDEDIDTDLSCGLYTHYDEEVEVCVTCGNGDCETYETCTASTITLDFSSGDCGPLYCPQDCET